MTEAESELGRMKQLRPKREQQTAPSWNMRARGTIFTPVELDLTPALQLWLPLLLEGQS